jgi:hypothetical protein
MKNRFSDLKAKLDQEFKVKLLIRKQFLETRKFQCMYTKKIFAQEEVFFRDYFCPDCDNKHQLTEIEEK